MENIIAQQLVKMQGKILERSCQVVLGNQTTERRVPRDLRMT